jgi:outer membrane protein assembly factor BamB
MQACEPLRNGAVILSVVLVLAAVAGGADTEADLAGQILKATEIKGGLVVHIGCGDGKLTAALRINDSYMVHGLDTDAKNVRQARSHIHSRGLYGSVSVDRFDGSRLPYIENLVNLVVARNLGKVTLAEVARVLAPEGVAYVKKGDAWRKTIKPRPKEIDAWTHYMHDANGNAVARDTVLAPVGRLQWQGGPRWSRHHEHMSSVSALVSSGKRIFQIFDEAPRVSIITPPDWKVIARDAFNGKVLWKRRIGKWYNHLIGLKSGPAILPRRLVAVGERVYVTLGINAPLSALDAASGKTILTYKGTEAAQEVIVSGGVIFLVAKKSSESKIWELEERRLMALKADSGKVLWRKDTKILPITLAADTKGVYLHDGEKLIGLDRTTGRELWASAPVACNKKPNSSGGPTLVVSDGVVLFCYGTITALDAADGKLMWTAKQRSSGYRSPSDMFVIDGMVLGGDTSGGRMKGLVTGYDLKTGKVKLEFPPDIKNYWFHHRCHRGKATVNYLLTSRTGVEFIDFRKKHWQAHQWVRGACLYGIMPCNGLLYAPQHPCACYPESKQNGFSALAPAAVSQAKRSKGDKDERGYPVLGPDRLVPEPADAERIDRGPAYNAKITAKPVGKGDWPTFRCDMTRSGHTKATVSPNLKPAWQARITGGRLSSFTIAEGKLLVAAVDNHTVCALDAISGKSVWVYTAGGPVDSPPTIYQGRAIFGCADGYIYCLRLSDGELIWRFRAAPADRRLIAFGRIESVWPLHGSVLLLEDRVYCVAGRSMFLDGGLRMLQLDPKTGRKIAETFYDDRTPDTRRTLQSAEWALSMPVALPDILTSDGKYVYMRSQVFDLKGKRDGFWHRSADESQAIRERKRYSHSRVIIDPPGKGVHLFAPYGFLEDSYQHRSYWVHGRGYDGGWKPYARARGRWPSGKILVNDETTVYGFGHKPAYYGWGKQIEHQLSAEVKSAFDTYKRQRRWTKDLPMFVRAMVLADKTLFVIGPPDLVDEEAIVKAKRLGDPAIQAKLAAQNEAWNGKQGSLLQAVSAKDGEKLAEYKIDALPVFDTLAAANGRLYFATTDGKVRCYKAK